jgi:hypothetical protein
MNPRLVLLAGLLAPTLLAPPAQAATAPTGPVRVAAPGLPFTVYLPRGWVGVNFKDGLNGVSIASRAKAPAALMRFTFIPKQGKALVLKNEFRGFEQAVRQGGTTLKLISERSVRYGGVNGLSHVYDLAQQGKKLRMQIWFGSGVKNFYNFQLTDQATTYSKNAALFAAALKSVRFD